MGSQKIQGELWGRRPKDWSSIQEATVNSAYEYALQFLKPTSSDKLLDVGCGSGLFSSLVQAKGADMTGIDASAALIERAKGSYPDIRFLIGEMEDLPFADNTFDIVCGFNSIQYAESVRNALLEGKRVLKERGKLAIMIWGNKEDCEAASYLKAVGNLLPPSPPGAAGPFALSENRLLEKTLEEAGLRIIDNTDVTSIWDYPNTDIALKGLLSAEPVAKAIENSGFKKVYEAVVEAIQPYILKNGSVVYKNKFRVVIAEN